MIVFVIQDRGLPPEGVAASQAVLTGCGNVAQAKRVRSAQRPRQAGISLLPLGMRAG